MQNFKWEQNPLLIEIETEDKNFAKDLNTYFNTWKFPLQKTLSETKDVPANSSRQQILKVFLQDLIINFKWDLNTAIDFLNKTDFGFLFKEEVVTNWEKGEKGIVEFSTSWVRENQDENLCEFSTLRQLTKTEGSQEKMEFLKNKMETYEKSGNSFQSVGVLLELFAEIYNEQGLLIDNSIKHSRKL